MRVRTLLPAAAVAMWLAAPAAVSADVPHTVTHGESLWSIAATDGLSVDQLATANGVAPDAMLQAGATIYIPPRGVTSQAPVQSGGSVPVTDGDGDHDGDGYGSPAGGGSATSPAVSSGGAYVVRPGDSLWAIAARSGTSVDQLAADNGLSLHGLLLAGRVLTVPGESGAASGAAPVASSAASAGGSASSQPVGAAAEGSSGGPPYPTPESVAPSTVGEIASANGVPPSLAEAIAYQESGFNNGVTSSADARGVMQILPGTWNWINQDLAGSMPLNPASAGSNIRAGVLLLRSLLDATGGNPALAAAGYYQGLPSVQRYGIYPSTQHYVDNVLALAQRF